MNSNAGIRPKADVVTLGRDDPRYPEALRLVIGDDATALDSCAQTVESFLQAFDQRGLRIEQVLAAESDGRFIAAVALLMSPGGTALVIPSVTDHSEIDTSSLHRLLSTVRGQISRDDITLMQSLLDPADRWMAMAHRDSGFRFLAELCYLQRDVDAATPRRQPSPNLTYSTYSPETAMTFKETLEATYVDSLDCPALAGVRDVDDIIRTHEHTGVHDPSMWFLAQMDGVPAGLILLSSVFGRSTLEVVYMGVVATARGNGVGDALLSLANDVARRRRFTHTTLAVDSTNIYGIRLYGRWGFVEFARRTAWIACSPR